MTTFYLVRHGKSEANSKGIISPDDSTLTKEGQAQARKVGRALKKLGVTIVVTSPLPRARETAEIIAKQLHVQDITVLEELRERGLGGFVGRPKDRPDDWYFTVDGEMDVEPRGVVIARAQAALAKIKKLAETGEVVVVGHGIAGYYLRQVAAGNREFEQFDAPKRLPNADYTKVTIVDTKPATPSARRPLWMLAVAALIVIGLIVWGMVASSQRPAGAGVRQQTIPLAPSDYNGDPNLQGAIQKQLQNGAAGTTTQAGGTQSPQQPDGQQLQTAPSPVATP